MNKRVKMGMSEGKQVGNSIPFIEGYIFKSIWHSQIFRLFDTYLMGGKRLLYSHNVIAIYRS